MDENNKIPVEVSARHIHLSQQHLDLLFGEGYKLTLLKRLTQPCDFAAQETLDVRMGSKLIPNVRIIGPVRENTQIELSRTDAINLKIKPPVRLSGDLAGSASITLVGPRATVDLDQGAIIAQRHIHASPSEAQQMGLTEGMLVSVSVESQRPVTFHNVKVRTRGDYKLCMHVDTDEGNAADIDKKAEGLLIKLEL